MKASLKRFVAGDVYNVSLLTANEAKWLFELLAEEDARQAVLLKDIVIQTDYFQDHTGENILVSFCRDNTAMEIVADEKDNCSLFIRINVVRRRIKNHGEQQRSAMMNCGSYGECFKNRIKHELGHYRHVKMGDDLFRREFAGLVPVSEYARKDIYEAFAEAYSIDAVELGY